MFKGPTAPNSIGPLTKLNAPLLFVHVSRCTVASQCSRFSCLTGCFTTCTARVFTWTPLEPTMCHQMLPSPTYTCLRSQSTMTRRQPTRSRGCWTSCPAGTCVWWRCREWTPCSGGLGGAFGGIVGSLGHLRNLWSIPLLFLFVGMGKDGPVVWPRWKCIDPHTRMFPCCFCMRAGTTRRTRHPRQK